MSRIDAWSIVTAVRGIKIGHRWKTVRDSADEAMSAMDVPIYSDLTIAFTQRERPFDAVIGVGAQCFYEEA